MLIFVVSAYVSVSFSILFFEKFLVFHFVSIFFFFFYSFLCKSFLYFTFFNRGGARSLDGFGIVFSLKSMKPYFHRSASEIYENLCLEHETLYFSFPFFIFLCIGFEVESSTLYKNFVIMRMNSFLLSNMPR